MDPDGAAPVREVRLPFRQREGRLDPRPRAEQRTADEERGGEGPEADAPDPGPTVCACLNVGLHTIRAVIEGGRALSVAALGQALGAGTSCGSCRPELAQLLSRFRVPEAAE